jgi:L-serine/L-threonine ammonia-lyase
VASGGNAGLAAALCSQKLGVKCTVFVHKKTQPAIIERMKGYGAEVNVSDAGWETVDRLARECVAADPNAHYVHPFVGEDVVRGHVSIVDEIYDQLEGVMKEAGLENPTDRPDVVSSAVGGGGFIRGIMTGLGERAAADGRRPTHVVGVSAMGGDPWGLSLETDHDYVDGANTSLAVSLNCIMCSTLAIDAARQYARTGSVEGATPETHGSTAGKDAPYLSSVRADDAQCGAAAWQATDELGQPIELSTGAAVVPVYHPQVLEHMIKEKGLPEKLNVIVVVCGGSRVDEKDIEVFREKYGKGYGQVVVDGAVVVDA